MTITVHHLENSRSQRVLWLLEELGMPYEVRRYERNKKTMLAAPELRRVHPLGKSPVIEATEAGETRVVAETGAIVEYLVDKAQGSLGAPPGRAEALRYRHFLHCNAEGSLMPVLFVKLVLGRAPDGDCRRKEVPTDDQRSHGLRRIGTCPVPLVRWRVLHGR